MKRFYLSTVVTTFATLSLGACSNGADAEDAVQAGQNVVTGQLDPLMANVTLPDINGAPLPADKDPNFIIMIGDDMGLETLNCYEVGNLQAHTPNLDKLCASGLRFDNYWSQPVCSPTRASILTGQYGFMNGIGAPLGPMPNIDWKIPGGPIDDSPAMGGIIRGMAGGGAANAAGGMANSAAPTVRSVNLREEIPAPDAPTENLTVGLKAGIYSLINALESDASKDYQTAVVGKWHLAGSENGGVKHPINIGFDHYFGPMRGGGVAFYDRWSKSVDGSDPFGMTGYVTSDTVDDGIKWIDTVEGGENPFFLWVAFNAPHTPFHMPPANLLVTDLKNLTEETASARQKYDAMLEAMDTEIGRLVASLNPDTLSNTYIAFMGDNGTPGQASSAKPYGPTKSKGTLYQGGVNVPFFIAGPGIAPGNTTPSLANSVDIYKTVLDLADVNDPKADAEAIHSVSLKPVMLQDINARVRDFAFADQFGVAGRNLRNARTIRNERYKLLQNIAENTEELFDLQQDPFENVNLLNRDLTASQQQNYDTLKESLRKLVNG